MALCLLGKFHTEHSFNIGAMKTVMKNVWKPAKGVIIKALDWNLFLFQFFAMTDKDYVVNEGPWAFNGSILLLKELTGLEQPSEVVFTKARFCVKAYDVPALKQTSTFAKFLGSQVGDFVDWVEESSGGIDKTLNFRVDVDVFRPLRRGVRTVVGGATLWIRLKYVKLPDFCYACGKLGHSYKNCDQFVEGMAEDDLQYGSWLRASPLRSRIRSAEAEIQEERKLMLAFRQGKEGRPVRTKLVFNSGKDIISHRDAGESAYMLVDSEEAVIPSGEVFKRKLVEGGPVGDVEKIRVIEGTSQQPAELSQWAEVAVQPRQGP